MRELASICPLSADFVVKVAEEEQRVWREARSLAYTQSGGWGVRLPTRLGVTLALTPQMGRAAEVALRQAWPTCGGSERWPPA